MAFQNKKIPVARDQIMRPTRFAQAKRIVVANISHYGRLGINMHFYYKLTIEQMASFFIARGKPADIRLSHTPFSFV